MQCCGTWKRAPLRSYGVICRLGVFLAMLLALAAFSLHGFHAIRLRNERCNLDGTLGVPDHQSTGASCLETFSLLGGDTRERAAALAVWCLSFAVAMTRFIMVVKEHQLALCRTLRGGCGACASAPAKAVRALCQCWREPEDATVRQEAAQLRVRQAQANMVRISLMTLPLLLFYVCCLGSEFLTTSKEELPGLWFDYLYGSGAVPVLCIAALSTLLSGAPSVTSPRSLNLVNVFMSAVWCWKFAVMSSSNFVCNEAWIVLSSLIQGLVCGNAPLTISLHAVVTAACAASWHWQHERHHAQGRPHLELRVAIFCVVSVAVWSVEQSRLNEARAVICSQRSSHASALVYGVLRGMSDAVVKLDNDLRLLEPSDELASLLLRQGPRRAGMHFTDFMSAADAAHLRKHFAFWPGGEREAEDPAKSTHALHLSLMDGNNARLPVELFYSCVPDGNGQPTYLVGIKEDRELSISGGVGLGVGVGAGVAQLASLPEAARVRHGIASSSWTTSKTSETSDGDEEDLLLWVDAASSDLRVLSSCSRFCFLGGPSGPCSALQEWLSSADHLTLAAWLRKPSSRCRICLKPPAAGGQYEATCRWVRTPAGYTAPAAPSSSDPRYISMRISPFKAHRVREDQVLKEAQKVRSRHPTASALSSSWSPRERPSGESQADVQLWIVFCDLALMILEVSGSNEAYRTLFEVNTSFRDWLEKPREFVQKTRAALCNSDDLPVSLGSFFLLKRAEPAVRFAAEVSLLGVSDEEAVEFPVCIALRSMRATSTVVGRPAALAL